MSVSEGVGAEVLLWSRLLAILIHFGVLHYRSSPSPGKPNSTMRDQAQSSCGPTILLDLHFTNRFLTISVQLFLHIPND